MNRYWKIGGAVAGVALAAALFLRGQQSAEPPAPESPAATPAAAAPHALGPLPPRVATPVPATPVVLAAADREFLKELRAKFAPHLADKHARIKAIEQIVAYLQQHYPGDWRERVRAFLEAFAPELLAELTAYFEGLMRLNEWLATHRAALMQMPPEERRAALWAARREAFGADAEAIYAGEVRSERIADALKAIDTATGQSTDEKLAALLDTVNQAWGEQAPLFLESRGTELMNRFLDVPSVQEDLRSQPPEARRDTLRRIREGMGMDAAALTRWDELDRTRDQAWDAGQQYRLQRDAILAQYQGAERERRLAQLQDQLFGAEAQAIREEEAAGFFRFDRPRRIGRE